MNRSLHALAPAEVDRMLAAQRQGREGVETWVESEHARLRAASDELKRRFDALAAKRAR